MVFGKEKYSREKYEEVENEREKNAARLSHPTMLWPVWVENIKRAQARMDKLMTSGHKEASTLNKEYDRLKLNAEEALKTLEQFEREKLGMHEGEQSEKGEQ